MVSTGTGKMTQCIKGSAAKPHGPKSSIPKIYTEDREPSPELHMYAVTQDYIWEEHSHSRVMKHDVKIKKGCLEME